MINNRKTNIKSPLRNGFCPSCSIATHAVLRKTTTITVPIECLSFDQDSNFTPEQRERDLDGGVFREEDLVYLITRC